MFQDVSLLKALLKDARKGLKPTGLACGIRTPVFPEISTNFGFRFNLIMQEHSFISDTAILAEMIRAGDCRNQVSFVKLNERCPILARDATDAGSYGVQVPFVDSAQILEDFLAEFWFSPKGRRGFCVTPRATNYGAAWTEGTSTNDFVEFINHNALVIPYIETMEAVENLDEILKVDGCPMFTIGVADLIFSMGLRFDMNSADAKRVAEAVDECVGKIKGAGKLLSCFTGKLLRGLVPPFMNEVDLPQVLETECFAYGAATFADRVRDHA